MNSIKQLDNSSKKKIIFLFFFSLIEFYCLIRNAEALGGIISTVLLFATVFWDKQLPLCIYIIKSILQVSTEGMVGTIIAVFISLIALYIIYQNIKNQIIRKYTFVTLYFFGVLSISYAIGINSHVDYAIRILVASLIILQIASCGTKERLLIIISVLSSGISMALIVLVSLYTGTIIYDASMRLQFDENSKTLSTALAPVLFTAVYLILFVKEARRLIIAGGLLLAASILFYMLIFTYSRGVLIALSISVCYLLLRYMGKMSVGRIVFLAIITIVVSSLLSNIQYDNEFMFDNVEGGNGRTAIWESFFFQLINTNSLLFGFGPGFTKDISLLGFYSHSTILDYLFCYGIAGFLYILYLLFYVVFNLFKIKERHLYFYQGLYLLSVIMFSTHGSAGTLLFNVVLGLCMSVVVMNKNTRRRLDYIRK